MIIASIDIGSNTVLLLIAEVDPETKKITPLKDEQRIPRLARGLLPGGEIDRDSEERLFSVLREYFEIIKSYECNTVLISGTNPFRIAANSQKIKKRIRTEFNAELNILTGKEEAEVAYAGTEEYGNKNESKLVIDIGGGSTELTFRGGKISYNNSFNAGVVWISENILTQKKAASASELNSINNYLKDTFNVLPKKLLSPDKAIALAGTPVTLFCIKNNLRVYNEKEVEGKELSIEDVQVLYDYLAALTPPEILKLYQEIVKDREDLILSGTSILLYLMKLLKIEKVIVSTKGIRYGAIRKFLSQDL